MLGKKTQAYGQIEKNIRAILRGTVVSIDPSIGSTSSMPGWAVYIRKRLVASGTFTIDNTWSTPLRLMELHRQLRDLYERYPPPDILVYEDIPARRQGRGNAAGHASLLKAVGAILAVPGPKGHVGLMPVSWKAEARDTYRKSDEADAVEMGWVAIQVALRIEGSPEEDTSTVEDTPKRQPRKKVSKKKKKGRRTNAKSK